MKILVSGCSMSVGYGFANLLNDPTIWPNLLGKKLNADITNVSIPGYDNAGIFLNAISELTTNKYDLILIQITSLNRIVVSPNIHSRIGLTTPLDFNHWKGRIDKINYTNFCRTLVLANQDFEHWNRLVNVIVTVQNLVDKGYNIKFVNGLLDWTPDFFNKDRSNFGDRILNVDDLPNQEIAIGVENLNRDKQKINLDLWINPFNNLDSLKVDEASSTDCHPGIKSQQMFSELIFNYLQQNNERNHHGQTPTSCKPKSPSSI
jgi:hypothetical protein